MNTKVPISISVAILAGISCLAALPQLDIPVWAIFIGWAQYFALGATPDLFKKIYPALIPGAILSAVAIILIDLLTPSMGFIPSMMLSVIITVFLLMKALEVPVFSTGLAAFNAYSVVFAAFYGGFFPEFGTFYGDLLIAFIWSLIGLFVGVVFGYLSIFFTFPQAEEASEQKTESS